MILAIINSPLPRNMRKLILKTKINLAVIDIEAYLAIIWWFLSGSFLVVVIVAAAVTLFMQCFPN